MGVIIIVRKTNKPIKRRGYFAIQEIKVRVIKMGGDFTWKLFFRINLKGRVILFFKHIKKAEFSHIGCNKKIGLLFV